MNHVLLGATIPFVIGVVIYVLRRGRAGVPLLILVPLAMAFMAIWAVAPDIPRMLGHQGLYLRLTRDPSMDIFLWHHTLDQLENSPRWYSVLESDSSWFSVGIALEAAALMGAAVRELFRKEPT